MYSLLERVTEQGRVLDLGAGPGSFHYAGFRFFIVGLDSDPANFGSAPSPGRVLRMCGTSSHLPFRDRSFALVICHHSLEHFSSVSATLDEIGRILEPHGSLFISVPDGAGFTDRLYRLLFAGGGHHSRFRRESLVDEVEQRTGTHLIRWTRLYTSFSFVARRHFVPRPRGLAVPPIPRRIRWLSRLPEGVFVATRLSLNVCVRWIDRLLGTRYSVYGWALVFGPKPPGIREAPGFLNVCSHCGAGHPGAALAVKWFFYRCPACKNWNPYFRSTRETL